MHHIWLLWQFTPETGHYRIIGNHQEAFPKAPDWHEKNLISKLIQANSLYLQHFNFMKLWNAKRKNHCQLWFVFVGITSVDCSSKPCDFFVVICGAILIFATALVTRNTIGLHFLFMLHPAVLKPDFYLKLTFSL